MLIASYRPEIALSGDTILQVRVKAEQAAAIQPKINFTSRGEGRLDLGFGAERKNQGLGELSSGQHSWAALRACGRWTAAGTDGRCRFAELLLGQSMIVMMQCL